jgi:hypothetical protein
MVRLLHKALLIAVTLAVVTACAMTPEEAMTLKPESLEQRQLQTRRFDTGDEAKILSACASLLQDLGFKIDEADSKLGVLVGSKQRSAYDGKQVATAIALAFFGVAVPLDTEQTMRICVVTKPVGDGGKTCAVRATFHRTVYTEQRVPSKIEELTDPKIYQTFFEKLSQALFLEAHDF